MAINNTAIETTGTSVFTAPGPIQEHAVTCVIFCNIGSTDAELTVNVMPVGSYDRLPDESIDVNSINGNTTIIKDLTIPAGETFTFDTEKLVLASDDVIFAWSDVADSLVCTVSSMRVS
jgi:hypothetical protein